MAIGAMCSVITVFFFVFFGVMNIYMKKRMNEEFNFRIAPKKEKRWIAYVKDQKRVGVLTFDSEHAIKTHYGDKADSFHEIEVEVNPKQ